MKMIKTLLLAMCCIVFFSCENNTKEIIYSDNLLVGNWSNATYEEGKIIFERVTSIPDDTYGVSFNLEGVFTEITSGWCATPPLVFAEVTGNYEMESNLIHITVNSYPTSFSWQIISLTATELIVTYQLTNQEDDYLELMELYNEIVELATSKTCENANDWSFTAYGSKACGGSQGYIAYPNSIDVSAFLQKVVDYTQKEDDYNRKWSIVSTCDLPAQPTGVICQNGDPILTY